MIDQDKKVLKTVLAIMAISIFVCHYFSVFKETSHLIIFVVVCLLFAAFNYSINRRRLIFESIIKESKIYESENPNIKKAQIVAHYGKLDDAILELKKAHANEPNNEELSKVITKLEGVLKIS
jgi:hypothetical protein